MWLEVDYATFMDALSIADRRGTRLQVSDVACTDFLSEEELPIHKIYEQIDDLSPTKVGIISEGLFKGIFRYDRGTERSFMWHVGELSAALPPAKPGGSAMGAAQGG